MPHALVLFDIDATLLLTGGAGIGAMIQTGKDLFNERFHAEGVDFAGRIDPLLIDELMVLNGVSPNPVNRQQFRRHYASNLDGALAASTGVRALPGVHALLDSLGQRAALDVGLLTGNFAETGRMKLRACAIDPGRFGPATAWGDDSPHDPPRRDHLPPVAMGRFMQAHGRPVEPTAVVVIGDTPHDVQCAHANGCRCIAVATGKFAADRLEAAGADAVFPDLSETQRVLATLDALIPSV